MDLKIKEVAELLTISETTVRRWLNEGKIPSYRLNGHYRFNRNEIEDWLLKEKLGIKEETSPSKSVSKGGFSLYRALHRGALLAKVPFRKKEEVIRYTMRYMAKSYSLDAEVLTEFFLDREKLMPTALNHGIGVPHTRDFLLNSSYDVVVAVFPEEPIDDYGALDNEPVHTLFFLFAHEGKNHLHLLAKIAHLSGSAEARLFFQTQPSKEQLLDYVKQWEGML